jgi:hypothetical protein
VIGTTVSVPVYDRSKTPHLFVGVVGIDLALAALDQALGNTDSASTESFQRVVEFAKASCPRLVLSRCEIESYRRQGTAKDAALCNLNCTEADYVQVEEQMCNDTSVYPTKLWQNTDRRGKNYEESACCIIGEDSPSTECPRTSELEVGPRTSEPAVGPRTSERAVGAIIGGTLGGLAGVAALAVAVYCLLSGKLRKEKTIPPLPGPIQCRARTPLPGPIPVERPASFLP